MVEFDFGQVDPPPPERNLADGSGPFSFTRPIECAETGLDISAVDIETGESTDFNFAIPCLT